ncbi:hypothetical protein J4Q44_G00367480 [Coregonus suidteri]|uniref:Uncharacterized protein n=1 Tax=Coregonus suidteri TaxID=861788 RepID=A0AAN8KKP4_9TELE
MIPIKDETGEATSKVMMNIFNTHGLDEWTNQTLKTAMGKSLDGYQDRWEDNLKISETPPDVVEVVEPDQNSFVDHLQARAEKDVENKESSAWTSVSLSESPFRNWLPVENK